MTKDYDFVFDLGKLSDEMIRSGMGHEDIRKVCAAEGARPPPRLPPLFDQMVSQKSFTNGKDDMPIVKKVQVNGLPPPLPLPRPLPPPPLPPTSPPPPHLLHLSLLQRSAFTHEFEKVHVLNFCRLDWGDDEATAIADIVTQYASAAGNLTDLRLHFNHVGDAGAAALAECLVTVPSLKELRLNGNKIGGAGAAALADALGRRKCAIESLGLGGNPLGDDGVIAICEAVVASAATLKVFIVDKCGLTDAAVPALCAALKVIGPTVAMLNLVNDGFTDDGRAQLQAAEPRLGTKNFTLVKEARGH